MDSVLRHGHSTGRYVADATTWGRLERSSALKPAILPFRLQRQVDRRSCFDPEVQRDEVSACSIGLLPVSPTLLAGRIRGQRNDISGFRPDTRHVANRRADVAPVLGNVPAAIHQSKCVPREYEVDTPGLSWRIERVPVLEMPDAQGNGRSEQASGKSQFFLMGAAASVNPTREPGPDCMHCSGKAAPNIWI